MFRVIVDNKQLETKLIEFSDYAVSVVIKNLPEDAPEHISISIDPVLGSKALDIILQSIEVLECKYSQGYGTRLNITINIPYLPYARADRAFEEGQESYLTWFMQSIQAHDHTFTFITEDVHNRAAVEENLYYNCVLKDKPQVSCLLEHLKHSGKGVPFVDAVIAPDKGAVEKSREIAEYLNVPLLIATKERDPATGRIMAIEPPTGLSSNGVYLIPDDLIDAGGTICALTAKMPVGSKKIVYATHGIFPKGLEQFMWVDRLLIKNIVGNYVTRQDIDNFNNKETN